MRIGIFGGTFDPVHVGHLILAEQAREQARLSEVWFLPAFRPPQKLDQAVTRFDQRVEMLQLATAGHAAFRVDEIEKELDLKVFIEAKDHVKLGRRIRRDQVERGYDLDDVLYRYLYHVMPVYESLIEPIRHKADIVIPNNRHFDRALQVLVGYLKAQIP